jgi:hypothetical protein
VPIVGKFSQETLAEMIGTTRPISGQALTQTLDQHAG